MGQARVYSLAAVRTDPKNPWTKSYRYGVQVDKSYKIDQPPFRWGSELIPGYPWYHADVYSGSIPEGGRLKAGMTYLSPTPTVIVGAERVLARLRLPCSAELDAYLKDHGYIVKKDATGCHFFPYLIMITKDGTNYDKNSLFMGAGKTPADGTASTFKKIGETKIIGINGESPQSVYTGTWWWNNVALLSAMPPPPKEIVASPAVITTIPMAAITLEEPKLQTGTPSRQAVSSMPSEAELAAETVPVPELVPVPIAPTRPVQPSPESDDIFDGPIKWILLILFIIFVIIIAIFKPKGSRPKVVGGAKHTKPKKKKTPGVAKN